MDWSPNTLHCGFLLAKINGWYHDAGIQLDLLTPETDDYLTTPAKKVVNGEAHLGIAPSESLISYATLRQPKDLISVAAILQRDLSSIVTLKTSGLDVPRKLDGKTYGSYGARFEDAIVQQIIRNDGGHGFLRIANPPKLQIWQDFLNGKVDATWIFESWEGLMPCGLNLELNHFRLSDFGIPYGYSPVVLCSQRFCESNKQVLERVMQITAKAYETCARHPDESAAIIASSGLHPNLLNEGFIRNSLQHLSSYLINDNGQWGVMSDAVWHEFAIWLDMNRIVKDLDNERTIFVEPFYKKLYTNAFLL